LDDEDGAEWFDVSVLASSVCLGVWGLISLWLTRCRMVFRLPARSVPYAGLFDFWTCVLLDAVHTNSVSVPGAEGEKEAEEEADLGPGPKDARPTRLKKKPAWLNDGNWQT
jgi:hypothetical protein